MDEWEIFNRLFVIVPEIRLDSVVMDQAIKYGWVSKGDYEAYVQTLKQANKVSGKVNKYKKLVTGNTLIQKIVALAPEIMSSQTIDMLSKLNLVDTQTAHALRLSLKTVGAVKSAAVSEETILLRAAKILSPAASEELVNLIRTIDQAQIEALRKAILQYTGNKRLTGADAADIQERIAQSIAQAERMRGVLRSGKILAQTAEEAARAKGVWDALLVAANGVFSDEMLKAAIKTGVISAQHYDTIRALEKVGLNVWTKSAKAFDYDSFWARAIMVSEGILSPEMVSAARQLGLIDDKVAGYMYDAVRLIRAVGRDNLALYVSSRKFRVTPGESPIQTYSRVTKNTDRYMMKLLAESAKRSREAAEAMAKTAKFGAATRAAQQRMLSDVMYGEMRKLSETMGYSILFGEKEAQRAALAAEEWLQREVLGRLSPEDLRSLRYTARAGTDSFLSRAEHKHNLSTRVYGNLNVWRRRIDKEIQIGLLRGLSAKEMAKAIAHLIRPDVRGGVSYAAMRLARTEINNAFHQTAIRYTREMPWVVGYQWHLSSSHPVPDICNKMAEEDHDGIGSGVYKKKNVPGKPHPHCFCYITTVDVNPGEFEKKLLRGSYDRYLNTTKNGGVWDSEGVREAQSNGAQIWEKAWGALAPQIAEAAFISSFRYAPTIFSDTMTPSMMRAQTAARNKNS